MTNKITLPGLVLTSAFLLPANIVYAGEHHGANALEHTAVAASHAEKGHLDLILENSREALHHAKIASQEHHDRHMHMEKAVTKLQEAIDHANKKHSDLASKAAEKALKHIHNSFN